MTGCPVWLQPSEACKLSDASAQNNNNNDRLTAFDPGQPG